MATAIVFNQAFGTPSGEIIRGKSVLYGNVGMFFRDCEEGESEMEQYISELVEEGYEIDRQY